MWYCSAVTQRRMAKSLGIARKTVERKFVRLSTQARKIHNRKLRIGELKSSYILMDEMEHYIRSRLKPADIALAVRHKTGEILEITVSSLNSRLNLWKQKKKYPMWANNSPAALEN